MKCNRFIPLKKNQGHICRVNK